MIPAKETEAVLTAFRATAKPWFRRFYSPDCCILSTRVAIEALGHFGVKAFPMTVEAFVFNRKFEQLVSKHGRFPANRAELLDWTDRQGGWSLGVGLGGDPEPKKWPGHLVAIVDRAVLIDCSLDQASRPHKGIAIPPIVDAPVTEDFIAGREPIVGRIGPLVSKYQARPMDVSYRRTPDWTEPVRLHRTLDPIVEEMSKLLAKETTE